MDKKSQAEEKFIKRIPHMTSAELNDRLLHLARVQLGDIQLDPPEYPLRHPEKVT